MRTCVALLVVVAMVAAVASAAPTRTHSLAGGVYRVGMEANIFNNGTFGWEDGFDPTGEMDTRAWEIYSNLLLRTLVGTNHVAGAAGNVLVPDLATSVPTPTSGGTRYSFTLKAGIMFGPPLDREITSADVRYAIERMAIPGNGDAGVAKLFRVIRGFSAYRHGTATSIAGITTPNARTIRFDLTRPAGYFPALLTIPATAPVPAEVARCFDGHPSRYGSDVIASGPYMIEGSGSINVGSCSSIKPISGLTGTSLTLVRNPSYDPHADSRAARENNPDRFVFVVPGSAVVVANKLTAGELEDADLSASPKVLAPYMARAQKRGLLRINPSGIVFYTAMNLTQPPFDDVHIRKAFAWIVDRSALRDVFVTPAGGTVPEHAVPNDLLGNTLTRFAPFATPGDHGNLARARAEIAKSKYAHAGGVCTAGACKRIHAESAYGFGPESYAGSQRVQPAIEADAAKIGLTFVHRGIKPDQPGSNNPIIFTMEWVKLLPDPANYLDIQLAGSLISRRENANVSLVGLSPALASSLRIKGRVTGVPSIDGDLARCNAQTGADRIACDAQVDRKVSSEIVPWVPFLARDRISILGPQVAKWGFDGALGFTAYAHVAVKH